MPEGIDGEIQDDLLQSVGIAVDFHVINLDVDLQLHSCLLG